MDGSSAGIIPHFEQLIIGGSEEEHVGKEGTNLLCSRPAVPGYSESDHPITTDLEGSIGAHAHSIVHSEVKSFPMTERHSVNSITW